MPSSRLTVQDTSPIIEYSSGQWRAGNATDDKLVNSYFQSSFTVTNITGASLSFTFNGTKVEIFGAQRANHGMYQFTLDGVSETPMSGSVPDPGNFQIKLFSMEDLTQGFHTVKLADLDGTYLDIDYITWETTIGGVDDKLDIITFQDTSPSFTYFPTEAQWGVVPNYLGTFSGGTGHATTSPGAFLKYTFDGDGVSLFGPVGPDQVSYSVDIDGASSMNLTARKEFYVSQSLLYHASSLGPGTHTLTLKCQQEFLPQETFAVDYAQVYTTTMPQSSGNTGTGGKRAPGVIIGPVVAVGGLIILGLLFVLFWRRHRAQKKRERSIDHAQPFLLGEAGTSGVQIPHPPPAVTTIPLLRQVRSRFSTTEGSLSKTRLPATPSRTSFRPRPDIITPSSTDGGDPPPYIPL